MASSLSTISISFLPQALARYNKNNGSSRKTNPKELSPNPNPRHKSRSFPPLPLSFVSGGEATTYTRLPPKDDFFITPFESPSQSATEVKLSDLSLAQFSIQKPSVNEIEDEVGEFSSEDEELGFDYGKFELFELNSDDENDSDYDEDENGDEELIGFKYEGSEGVESEEGEDKEKEKGVPAVMRCFDRTKIYVKAGDGGNGVVAIRREKFVPLGGPSGGDGGRGGHVYMEVDGSMNSLLPFRQSIHYRAGRGSHGKGRNMHGAKGESVVVKVPPGTVVREAGKDGEQGEVLLELLHPGQRALLLPGGRGGRGNAAFKSGKNRVPKIAENGEEGAEM